jgi:hypothetical protein
MLISAVAELSVMTFSTNSSLIIKISPAKGRMESDPVKYSTIIYQ